MKNHEGEKALASAVLVQTIQDIKDYEDTCDKQWRDRDETLKQNILRYASDAISCIYTKNDTMTLWLAYLDLTIEELRYTIRVAFPKTVKALGVMP